MGIAPRYGLVLVLLSTGLAGCSDPGCDNPAAGGFLCGVQGLDGGYERNEQRLVQAREAERRRLAALSSSEDRARADLKRATSARDTARSSAVAAERDARAMSAEDARLSAETKATSARLVDARARLAATEAKLAEARAGGECGTLEACTRLEARLRAEVEALRREVASYEASSW